MNDLPKAVKPTLKLYVDNALLYKTIYSITNSELLQKDLDIINS